MLFLVLCEMRSLIHICGPRAFQSDRLCSTDPMGAYLDKGFVEIGWQRSGSAPARLTATNGIGSSDATSASEMRELR